LCMGRRAWIAWTSAPTISWRYRNCVATSFLFLSPPRLPNLLLLALVMSRAVIHTATRTHSPLFCESSRSGPGVSKAKRLKKCLIEWTKICFSHVGPSLVIDYRQIV
jgi:hypothetical protein